MRHCSIAVPFSKIVKGHMGQTPHQMLRKNQSKLYQKNYNKPYKGRIVTTSHTFNGVSTNWKLDVYKYKNYSYAQVVNCPRGGDLSATPSMATSRASPSQVKSGKNKVSGHYRDRISSQKMQILLTFLLDLPGTRLIRAKVYLITLAWIPWLKSR